MYFPSYLRDLTIFSLGKGGAQEAWVVMVKGVKDSRQGQPECGLVLR